MSVKNMKKSEKGIKIVPIVKNPTTGERILSVSLPKIRPRKHDTSPLVRYFVGGDSCDPKVKNVGNKIVETYEKKS